MLLGGLKKPGSVAVHSSALVRLVTAAYVPSGQGKATAEPSGQNFPSSHGAATTVALVGHSWPGLQRPAHSELC
eukprot:5056395-Prymnesium_polylepis.1